MPCVLEIEGWVWFVMGCNAPRISGSRELLKKALSRYSCVLLYTFMILMIRHNCLLDFVDSPTDDGFEFPEPGFEL